MKYLPVSNSEVNEMIIEMAGDIIRKNIVPDVIVGVSRGADQPARLFSDILLNNRLYFVKIERYTSLGKAGIPKITHKIPKASIKGYDVLLVDDVSDRGDSLLVGRDYLDSLSPRNIKTVTLHVKAGTRFLPDVYAREVGKDTWVIYPWDRFESARDIIKIEADGLNVLRGIGYSEKELGLLQKTMKISEV